MKNLVLVLITVIFLGSVALGQGSKFDSRLSLKYSEKELKKIEKENPSEIRFLTYCIDNAQYITVFPKEKEGAVEIIGEIEIKDITHINFYELNVELIQDNYQYYKVKNSDKLLVIKSKNHIVRDMK